MVNFTWRCSTGIASTWALWGQWDLMHRSIGVYADVFPAYGHNKEQSAAGGGR